MKTSILFIGILLIISTVTAQNSNITDTSVTVQILDIQIWDLENQVKELNKKISDLKKEKAYLEYVGMKDSLYKYHAIILHEDYSCEYCAYTKNSICFSTELPYIILVSYDKYGNEIKKERYEGGNIKLFNKEGENIFTAHAPDGKPITIIKEFNL